MDATVYDDIPSFCADTSMNPVIRIINLVLNIYNMNFNQIKKLEKLIIQKRIINP
jgi:hypothetical protein